MNDTTFQGDGKVAYVPVVVNTKLTKQTNADKLRAMSDEELAVLCEGGCPPHHECPGYRGEDAGSYHEICQKCWLDWLRQEVSDGD